MINRPNTKAQRLHRHKRVRGKVSGTPERPRLNVFRRGTTIYAQIFAATKGITRASASSQWKGSEGPGSICEAARRVGEAVARRARRRGRGGGGGGGGGYLYHGRVKALAEGAREGGLKF